MQVDLSHEAVQAEALLRQRLDRDLSALFDQEEDFAEALLRYLQRRRTRHLLFDFDNLATIAELARTHDPEETAWEQEIAENAREGRLYGASNPYCRRFLELDRENFDFSSHPHPDPQTIRGLNRHRWLAALARIYWLDQDESWFHAIMSEWDYFISRVPWPDDAFLQQIHAFGPHGLNPPYGELDLYIRLTNWYWAYWLMVPTTEMTPQRNLVLLARCLRLFDLVAARGIATHEHNFTSMQMEALYFWASALPEIEGMTIWKHAARNTCESSLLRAVEPDGVQWERSAGYHAGCIRWYGTSFLLGQRQGQPWAAAYGERLKAMGHYLDAIITPDGKLPLISDSDRVRGWEPALGLLRAIFPELAFQHSVAPTFACLWMTNGSTWTPEALLAPPRRTDLFPHGGFAVIRSSCQKRASQVIIDNGSTRAGHCHKANLTIHWDACEAPVIVDPGRWMYDSTVFRNWVIHGESHNTILPLRHFCEPGSSIDEPAIPIIHMADDPRLGGFEATESAHHTSVTTSLTGFRVDQSASVRRTVFAGTNEATPWLVVADRYRSAAPELWISSWLVPGEEPATCADGGLRLRLSCGLHLAMTWHDPQKLERRDDEMFWCPNYGEKAPARWLRFGASASTGSRVFAFTVGSEPPPMPLIEPAESGLRIHLPDYLLPVTDQP